jgi:hypothetical protein
METSDELKTALVQAAEAEMLKFIEELHSLKEGDLKGLEHAVLSACMAVGRGWLEQVLSQRGSSQRAPTRRSGECGHEQRLMGQRPKQLLTLLGKVSMSRPYYHCLRPEEEQQDRRPDTVCAGGQAPADAIWGVSGGRTTPGVQEVVSYLGAMMTLEEAAQTVCRLLPLGMSARQALNLMQPVGEALADQEAAQVQALWQQAAQARSTGEREQDGQGEEIERLYIEMDGVMARLRRGSVPMEAPEQQQTGDVYREVKVGAVFAASRGRERSELVPGIFLDEPSTISYLARRTTAEQFGPALYALAHRCGLPSARQVVVLGDGAPWIWRLAAEQFPAAVQIVDLWHAREHVWKVARAVYGAGTAQVTAWAEQACDWLVQGNIETLVAEIAGLPPISPEPGTTRSVPQIEMHYFITNAARMRYPAFRQQGMHVGSGIAEAACKTVVSTRAKRSGMRWSPEGLDALLALHTTVLNQTYDAFWQDRSQLVT